MLLDFYVYAITRIHFLYTLYQSIGSSLLHVIFTCYVLVRDRSFIIYEVGGGILSKVVANVANHLDKTYVMVHDDECEGKI